jgi:hypothetical protein
MSSQLPPKLRPLFSPVPYGKSFHESRTTTTATRHQRAIALTAASSRKLITFSIATGNRSRPAYRRLQAIRARI